MRVDLILLLLLALAGSGLLLWAVPRWQQRHPDARSLRLLHVLRAGLPPLALLIPLLALRAWLQAQPAERGFPLLEHLLSLALIATLTWMAVRMVRAVRELLLEQVDISSADNLHARKLVTQFGMLERLVIGLLIFLGSAAALMTFDSVRQLGASLLASAGIAGIIIGFAAQRSLATIAAGLQIAITQPIRIDDVVIVEGEWGRIEEITLTYVVVRIWDLRRLVLPITYFIEQPFQNWTRTSAALLGTVTLHLDYGTDLDKLRAELQRLVAQDPRWDGEVANVQVTGSDTYTMEVRVLVGAADSGTLWELRVMLREQLLAYLRREDPDAWGRVRVELPPGTLPGDTGPQTPSGAGAAAANEAPR